MIYDHIDQLKEEGRIPKIFTSEQIHAAANEAIQRLIKQHPSAKESQLVEVTYGAILSALGLKKPEDFYEPI